MKFLKTKHINLLGILFFVIFLILYPFAALRQHARQDTIYYLFALVVFLIFVASLKIYKDVTEEVHDLENHTHIMLGVIIGGVLTFILNTQLKLGAELAA